jgi:dipeptidyl aminopeptidase/acylaminoacyl peptidase
MVRRSLTPVLAVLAACALAPLPAVAQSQPLTTELALDVRTPSVLALTDDGRRAVVQLNTRRGRTDTDHFRFGDATYIAPRYAEVHVVETGSGETTRLGEGPIQVGAVAWSPNGDRLAYTLRDGDRFELRVWEAGSGADRRVELATSKEIASNTDLEWSPDGDRILLALRPEGWAAEARGAFEAMTEANVVIQDSGDDFLSWEAVRNQGRRQILATVSVDDGAVEELLEEMPLQSARYDEDGEAVLYSVSEPLKTPYGRRDGVEYSVWRLPLDDGAPDGEPEAVIEATEDRIRASWNDAGDALAWADDGDVFYRALDADSAVNLTADHREIVEDGDTTEISFSVVAWHPQGESMLVSTRQGWHLLAADGGEPELVMAVEEDEDARPERDFEHWSPNGDEIWMSYSEPDRWWRGLQRLDVGSGAVEDVVVSEGLYRGWTFAEDGETALYRYSDGDRPDALHALDGGSGATRELMDPNPQLADVALARTELVEYLDVDGNTLYGILYYPQGYRPGEAYPLVVEVYEDFFDNGYNENMNLVTAQGWFGFRPSVELEIGYPGEAWLKAVPNAVNALIDRGLVDPDQVGIYGQSYGGYAVNLLVTQTDRFAAAANVSGKVNIISFLGDSPRITTRNYDAAEVGQDRIGATLWEQPHKYVNTSAVMFADRIETPLLLLSGEGDWNVPATNQREMYYALRRLGKEVVWVNYMKGGHGAGRASSAEDFHDHWNRMFDWFREHFEAEVATATDGSE